LAAEDGMRREEIAANLREVRERIRAACAKAGRDPAEITLVAVTKTWPASDVLHLAALGVTDVGENRDQEAAPKAAEVAAAGVDVRWHFVGQLQRNKCSSVARYAAVVHSVDGVRLAGSLDRAAGRSGRPITAFVQVSIDGNPTRGGAIEGGVAADHADHELAAVLDAVAGAEYLVLSGLMAVAPLGWEPGRAFERLAEIRDRMLLNYPHATQLSAGMSGDVEDAIDYGATHVRMGTSVLGKRPRLM
jgi:pyridoxal phosphate enzyme (YggS family)